MEQAFMISAEEQYRPLMDKQVLHYIQQGHIKSFESFSAHTLFSFDWYDIAAAGTPPSQILVYLDQENLLFLCREPSTLKMVQEHLTGEYNAQRSLYLFFVGLIANDMNYLERFETEITETENEALKSSRNDYLNKIVAYRRELLRLKRYYDQLDDILDNLAANDNGILTEETIRHFTILGNRSERIRGNVLNLRDYVTQMREAYQAQIDIEQNSLMKVFTLVTAVFLPLSLMVGWYGMNFKNMPELNWQHGYPIFILFSLVLSAALIIYFKKKKWL